MESNKKEEAQKEFINIVAHELRNPLQPILGLSDVLPVYESCLSVLVKL